MKKILWVFGLLVVLATSSKADQTATVSLIMDPTDSGEVVISTGPSTPTQILSNNPSALRTYIINLGSNTVFLAGGNPSATTPLTTFTPFSVSISTGSFFLVGSSGTVTFSPDGVVPFTGPMWAFAQGQGGTTLQRARFK